MDWKRWEPLLQRKALLIGAVALAVLAPAGIVFGRAALDASDSPPPVVLKEPTPTTAPPASLPEPTPTAVPLPPRDTTPPALTITRPEEGAHVSEKAFTFKGTTEPAARVAVGQFQANVDGQGNWSLMLILSPGANTVSFTATDGAGNAATASVTVTYDVPQEKPVEKPKESPKEHPKKDKSHSQGFWAEQKFGSCSENPPYDVFYGKGTPGTHVSVSSPYGSGSTTVGDDHHWKAKVFFPSAPIGQAFEVTVTSSDGGQKTFQFTRTG
jgi:hypothetical protein